MRNLFSQNINFGIVMRMQGWLLLIEATFMLLPIAASLYFGELDTVWAFGGSAVVTGVVGMLMAFCIHPRSSSMRKREGLLLTALVWVFFSLFGMLPFLLSGTLNSVTDAFFEAMAGFTTTGTSVIAHIDNVPHGVLLWRALSQWIGGMGIILFTLAVIPMLNHKGGITLFNAEVTGITHEKLKPRISQTAKNLWFIYIALTVVVALLLMVGPMDWFDAVCHALSTTSTGGYTTKSSGLLFWNSTYVLVVISIFMFLGGINFALIYAILHGNWGRIKHNNTFRIYCLMIVIGTIIIIADMVSHGMLHPAMIEDWQHGILAVFEAISATTSTAFAVLPHQSGSQLTVCVLAVAMFFGGMAGSTSGGAKLDRLIVLGKSVQNELYRALHPSSVRSVHVDGKPVPRQQVSTVNAFFALYLIVIAAVAIWLAAWGVPVGEAFFASASTIANSGMGYGASENPIWWACLPTACKWALTMEMLVGRLELFTVIVLFTRSFWSKD